MSLLYEVQVRNGFQELLCFALGYSPKELRGSRTGVFVGVSGGEAVEAWTLDPETLSGYTMSGCQRAMISNRLSFYFDLKGL